MKLVEIAKQYKDVFKQNGLDIKIMPLQSGSKNPTRKHKGGVYDDKIIFDPKSWVDKTGKKCNLGWLLNESVFCLDIDGYGNTDEEKSACAETYYNMFKSQYDLSGAWIEKTRKGYHLIWKKSKSMKDITVCIDAFKKAGYPGIDLMTISANEHDGAKTNSILCVNPSAGKEWLPSHSPFDNQILEPPTELATWIETNINKSIIKPKKESGHGTDEEVRELKLILDKLPAKYYELTKNGGEWALWHKVTVGIQYLMGADGYDEWVKFCKRSSLWNEEMQEKNKTHFWNENINKNAKTPVKIGSFRYWIQSEDPASWLQIKGSGIFKMQMDALFGTFNELAELSASELPDVVYNQRTKSWCKFENGEWNLEYDSPQRDINHIVRTNFKNSMTSYWEAKYENETEGLDLLKKGNKTANLEDTLDLINKVSLKFGNESEKIIKLMKIYSSPKGGLTFDENPWLLGFHEGDLYDLKAKKFRKALKEDYVTLKCGYSRAEIENVTEKDLAEIKQFMKDILPDEEIRNYQLYLLALSLNGIEAKRFCCQNGSGANGKSTLFGLCKWAFGDYCKNISTAHYTTPFRESGARPDLLDLQGTRLFIATEPSEGEQFNSGSIKKITGGDPIRCRGMYHAGTTEFYCIGQHNVLCNDLPNLQGVDGGVLRRIVNFYYPTKFVADPDPTKPNEKKRNTKCKTPSYFKDTGAAFLSMLLRLHNQYLDSDEAEYELEPPEKIKSLTKEWLNDSLSIVNVVAEHYEPSIHSDDNVGAKELYGLFRESEQFKSMSGRERRTWSKKFSLNKLEESDERWLSCKTINAHGTILYKVKYLSEPSETETD